MSASLPPSQQIAGKSSNSGLYLLGMLVLAALMGGLIYWKLTPEPPPTAPTRNVDAATSKEVKAVEPPPLHAPPPPPPVDEVEDAGTDAGKVASNGGPSTVGKSPCSAKCGDGESSPALNSAIKLAAQSAQGCYNRALRTSEASGKMMVSVQVASTGAVCSASISNDSVGSGEIASCVLGRFRGKSLPPPRSGCVVVNVPINFVAK